MVNQSFISLSESLSLSLTPSLSLSETLSLSLRLSLSESLSLSKGHVGLFWGGVKLGTGLGREKGVWGVLWHHLLLQSFHSASPQSSPLLARWRVRGIATLLLAPRPSSVQPRLLRAAAAPHRSESTLSVLLLPCHHPCRHNGKGGGC